MKLIFLSILVLVTSIARISYADKAFDEKLSARLRTADKSIKLLQQQIIQSQSAPFLPDLYLQLAQLHSEKSTSLYFVQRERQKNVDAVATSDKAFAPVIEEQHEAIKIYQLVLKDFPNYQKRNLALFRLCVALKSVDENAAFEQSAFQLLKQYPDSEQASSIRLILGQQLLEQQNYAEARQVLTPVLIRPFAYERNLARYRLGMVDIGEAKFTAAMKQFEEVINDPQLKAQEDNGPIEFKSRTTAKIDLKRQALLESVRAYTYVYEKNADPVAYYSHLAPNEPLFRETIEKLAQRYIELKNTPMALDLLRNIGRHTNDPQKSLNIYRQVLSLLSPDKRAAFPPDEMRFVLERYVAWSTDYSLSNPTKLQVADFFEKQVRELATSLHQSAQSLEPSRKQAYLKRASEFYIMYLAIFPSSPHAGDMALDLADVYYSQGNFLKSGEYYLEIFQDKFGLAKDKRAAIENAILCLQKKGRYSFFETARMRGLLIAAIEAYTNYDRKKEKDPNLKFLLVKTRYDQGFFPEAINQLYAYAHDFKNSPQSADAAEIILDYFNTQSDFASLIAYCDKLLALKLPNTALNEKIARIRIQSNSKEIHEKIRNLAGYSDFEQSKSYLSLALVSQDSATKSLVLKEALNKSQSEGDVQTFVKVATLMLGKENSVDKKQEILLSLAQEMARVSHYYQALYYYRVVFQNGKFSESNRIASFEQSLQLALVLRDWSEISELSRHPLFAKISASLRKQLQERLLDYFESPIPGAANLLPVLVKMGVSDPVLLVLFKAQQKLAVSDRQKVLKAVQKRCEVPKPGALCSWLALGGIDSRKNVFLKSMLSAAPSLESIQSFAQTFSHIEADYRRNEGSDDPFLETVISLRTYELYSAFGRFLKTCAQKNPNLRAVLDQKVSETLATAKISLDHCKAINEKSFVIHAALADCRTGVSRPLVELLRPLSDRPAAADGSDSVSGPGGAKIEGLSKTIFSSGNNAEVSLKLALAYLSDKHFSHAAALSTYGISLYKDHEKEFRTVLGCSVMSLGYWSEANYNLSESDAVNGLRDRCLKQMDNFKNHETSRNNI